jgi:hypothetical protein
MALKKPAVLAISAGCMIYGEAAAFVVLETEQSVQQRQLTYIVRSQVWCSA